MACSNILLLLLLAAQNSQQACHSDQFQCQDGSCIKSTLRCDDSFDCADLSDEISCNSTIICPESLFRCNNGQCVTAHARCNGIQECGDGTDEQNCGVTVTSQITSPKMNTPLIEDDRNNSSGLSKSIIIAIVVPLIVLFLVLIFGLVLKYKYKKHNVPENSVQPNPVENDIKKDSVTEKY